MKKMLKDLNTTTIRTGLLLLILLVLPVFIYSAYQLIQRGQHEQMIRDSYNRQLDVILFSVNQYSWNLYKMWEDAFFAGLADVDFSEKAIDADHITNHLMQKHDILAGTFVGLHDRPFYFSFSYAAGYPSQNLFTNTLLDILHENEEKLKQTIQNAESGYWRPLIVNWPLIQNENITLFIFPLNQDPRFEASELGGIFLDTHAFIQREMNQQLQAILSESDNLMLGIYEADEAQAVYRTSDEMIPPFDRTETIWLLPEHQLTIKTRGLSLSALARKRMQFNFIFLITVNLLVISGMVFFLYNMNQQLRLAQMKTDFVANVSHELRTPLSLIRMYAETLEMGRIKDPLKARVYYRTIMQESQRLSQLINNILDFSRIEANQKQYQFQLQSVVPIVREVLQMYDYQFKKLNVKMQVNWPESLPDLYLDKDAVTQVVINLIDNAIKFSPDQKCIELTLSHREQKVELAVQDQGIGIAMSDQKLIFNQFYRAGGTLIHDTKGSGLGLTLVRHIMEMHKGCVTAESRLGKGSCFKLIFPVPAYPEKLL